MKAARSDENLRGEHFLEEAIVKWLPRIVASAPEERITAQHALRVLANRVDLQHHDPWLSDLLAGKPSAGERSDAYVEAVRALSRAVSANRAGHRAKALSEAVEARRLFEISGNRAGESRARLEQVYAFSRSFQPRECLQEGELLARKTGLRRYKWAWAQLHLERSMCAARLGDFELALKFMQIALQTTRESRYSTLHLRALGLNASLQTNIGNIPASWRENWKGLQLFWNDMHPPMRAYQFYSELSFAAERDRQWSLGHLLAREASTMSELTGSPLMQAIARHRLAMFASRLGHREESLGQLQRASELLESVKDEPSIRIYWAESAITVSGAYLDNDDVVSAERLLHAVDAKETFDGSLLIKFAYHRVLGLIHYRRGRVSEAKLELGKAAEMAARAVGSIESARERATWKHETTNVYRTLVRIELEEKNPRNAFHIWEQFRSVTLNAAKAERSLTTGRPALAAGSHRSSSVLSYAQFDDGLALWLFDNRGLEYRWIGIDREQLARLCTTYLELCRRRDSNSTALAEASRAVYDRLIRPMAIKLERGRLLLIEPDGPVAGIPMEALMDGSGSWLADRFTVITSPGLWSEIELRGTPRNIVPELHAVAVSNPVLTGNLAETLAPLPDTEAEAETVANHFRSRELLAGTNATVAAVKQALDRAQIFHFAGHSMGSDASGALLLAGGPLGEDGVLGAAQLETAPRHCRLAVLSACSTAVGERHGTTNVDSLVQAFWRAGVSNVIASRWDVDSGHTARFFAVFYGALGRRQSAGAALAEAAAEFRLQAATSHPYFWAAFHVFGCADS